MKTTSQAGRPLIALAAALSLSALPSLAQEADRTTITVDDAEIVIDFKPTNCSPGLECPYFALSCGGDGLRMFVHNLDGTHIERWAVNSAAAEFVIADALYLFPPYRMTQNEERNWVVRLDSPEDPVTLLQAFYDGGAVFLGTPFYTFEVVPSETDLDNMAAFAVGCIGEAAAG